MRIIILFLSFTIFGSLLHADEDLAYLLKSHQWDKLEEIFKKRPPNKESEVYALIEFHEKSPKGDRELRFRYLASLVRGIFLATVTKADIQKIIEEPLPYQTIPFKLSYWKLYEELVQRGYLSYEEKVEYLKKLEKSQDPISRKGLAELGKLLKEKERHKDLVDVLSPLRKDSKLDYLVSPELLYAYSKSLYQVDQKEESKQELVRIVNMEDAPEEIKKQAAKDWKNQFAEEGVSKLSIEEIAPFLNYLPNESKDEILKNKYDSFKSEISTQQTFKQIALFLARMDRPDLLKEFLKRNDSKARKDPELITKLSEILYINKNYNTVAEVVSGFTPQEGSNSFKFLQDSYEKLGDKDKQFEALVRYLSANPFNLSYHDKLIEMLVSKDGDKLKFANKNMFIRAMTGIPNMPVKGRLVYWYLRSLRQEGDLDRLNTELDHYYEYCPGSYYSRVIHEEFEKEISAKKEPENPLRSKQELIRYLSFTAGIPEKSDRIIQRNLSFAYFPGSVELGVRLSYMTQKIQTHRLLILSAEYFKLGEDRLGLSLLNQYIREENLSDTEKEELLVALGDISKNTYLSAYYTRSLLKRLLIPDDPILLPTSISSRIYPRPHRTLVQKYAEENEVPEDVIYAVMRQESFFRETATSRTNAQGLMQLMPATAREIARNMGVSGYSLFSPHISIQMGSKFLSYLLRSNDNDLRWATIAYNGGPGNLRKWKRNHYNGDFNHFLEELPVKESRDYCRIVLSNYYAYDAMKKFYKL